MRFQFTFSLTSWDFSLPFWGLVRFQFTFHEVRFQFTFLWGEISIYLSMRWDFNLPFHWRVENSIYLSEDCWDFNLPFMRWDFNLSFYEVRFQFTFSLMSWEFNLPFWGLLRVQFTFLWAEISIYLFTDELRLRIQFTFEIRSTFQFTHRRRAEISIYPPTSSWDFNLPSYLRKVNWIHLVKGNWKMWKHEDFKRIKC